MEGEGKEFAAYFEDDNLLRLQVSRSHSPTMDTELFRVISPLHTQPTDATSETELPNSVKVQGSLNMGANSTVSDAEALGVGERRKIPTDKGKQHELQRLQDHRTVALRHVTRQINKMKPLLAELDNYEFVSVEMEGLNNLLVKLQDTQDNYVDALENETDIVNANSWYDAHDGDIFKFKQSVIEYLTKAKRRQSAEVNSVISGGSHHTKKSNHSKRSTPSSISSKAKLIQAKTKVAALEIEASFLKEKQALKMAAEQLELKQSLVQAREEERIYEEMKNEESTLAPVHTQSPPICTMQSGNFAGLKPTSQQKLVRSLGVTDYQQPLQASPLSAFTVPQKGPIYTTPIQQNPMNTPQVYILHHTHLWQRLLLLRILLLIRYGVCHHHHHKVVRQVCQSKTILSKTLWKFNENKLSCLRLLLTSKQGVFCHRTSLCFMVMLWSIHYS